MAAGRLHAHHDGTVGTLGDMSLRPTWNQVLAAAVAACLAVLLAAPALAVPAAAQTSADLRAVTAAVERYEAAQARAASIDARAAETSARLDSAMAQETQARDRLRSRVLAMYRSGDINFVSVLLGASTVQDFASRWDLLSRLAGQDAETLRSLKAARIEAERSAKELLELQAAEARALDATAAEVAAAKKELAASQAALAAYQARTAQSARPARAVAAPAKADSTQQLTGSGAWKTGVASHYGRNFTGRGASGEKIGPYSMIVAHKTLPFGTLIEFEYNGKRAVAKVADRGPHSAGRDFDLGPGVVRVLDFSGVHEVRYRIIGR